MKKFLSLLMLMLLCTSAWAAKTSSLVFTQACGGTGTADDGAEWTVTSDANESAFDTTKGIHYGTGNAAVSYLNLTTSGISGTITSVKVNASGASGTTAKLNVTVGGEAFGNEISLASSATEYEFTGSASGTIVVALTQTSAKKALYLKSIIVTYDDGTVNQIAPTFTIDEATMTTGQHVQKGKTVVINKPEDATSLGYVYGKDITPSEDDYSTSTASINIATNNYNHGDHIIAQATAYYEGDVEKTANIDFYINDPNHVAQPGESVVFEYGNGKEFAQTTNASNLETSEKDGITITFEKGEGTQPAWYSTGTGSARIYANNTISITAPSIIESVTFTYYDETNHLVDPDCTPGTFEDGVWTVGAKNASLVVDNKTFISAITVKLAAANAVATPVISGETPFTQSTQVTITCDTEGATIYYTIDDNDPTNASTQYTAPFSLTQSATVKAIAYSGENFSGVASKAFVKEVQKPATPVIAFDPETAYEGENVTCTIACETEGAAIQYSTDGTTYTDYPENGFSLTATTTVYAKATKDGVDSDVAEKTMTFDPTVANIAALTQLTNGKNFRMTGEAVVVYVYGGYLYIKDDTGSTLIYNSTVDGIAAGNTISNLKGKVSIHKNLFEVVSATYDFEATQIAVEPVEMAIPDIAAANMNQYVVIKGVTLSDVNGRNMELNDADGNQFPVYSQYFCEFPTDLEETYDVTGFVSVYNENVQLYPTDFAETPQFTITINPETYDGTKPIEVSITCENAAEGDVAIAYTLDGSDPSVQSALTYNGPFTIYKNCTVKAYALDKNMSEATAEKAYTITLPDLTLKVEPTQGEYAEVQTVTASVEGTTYGDITWMWEFTPTGATEATSDGETNTATVSESGSLYFYGVEANTGREVEGTFTYTITLPTYTITLDNEPGDYSKLINVKVTNVTPALPDGATLKYTIDDADPVEYNASKGVYLFKSSNLTFTAYDADGTTVLATAGGEYKYIVNVFGDLNNDGKVDTSDLGIIVNLILGKY